MKRKISKQTRLTKKDAIQSTAVAARLDPSSLMYKEVRCRRAYQRFMPLVTRYCVRERHHRGPHVSIHSYYATPVVWISKDQKLSDLIDDPR